MARVTVEDCVLRVPNRFELVALAAQRARDISAGSPLTVDRDRLKALPASRLHDLAQSDHLEMIYAHLLSLGNLDAVGARLPESSNEKFLTGLI